MLVGFWMGFPNVDVEKPFPWFLSRLHVGGFLRRLAPEIFGMIESSRTPDIDINRQPPEVYLDFRV